VGVDITLGNARTLIENAIVDALSWAYGRRLPAVADVATLRATASTSIPDRSMRVVTAGGGYAWQWQVAQLVADDGVNFVQPSDVASGLPGRWCRTSSTGITSTATSGYLVHCDNYNDDSTDLDVYMQRVFGGVPAVLLSFDGIEREPKSNGVVGGIDWCVARFTLFAVSFNPRGRQAARQGSPVPAEFADDPGTAGMLGDAMLVLKGAQLGLNDVAYVRVGNEYPVVKDLARRRYVDALDLEVRYTETLPDTTLVPLSYPHAFNVAYKLADVDRAGNLDLSNDVTTTGLQFALGDGLTKSFAGGSMNFNGSPLTIAGAAKTFAPNVLTYRDVDSSGALYYAATPVGDAPPALAYGRVRLGVTATDGTGVRVDRLLAASLIAYGPTDSYEPAPIVSITISPTNISLPTGTPVQFTATGTDSDGASRDVTALVTWTSDNANTAFTPAGVANTSSPGTAHVAATLNGVTSNTATLTAT
jgi:hypothetical protein